MVNYLQVHGALVPDHDYITIHDFYFMSNSEDGMYCKAVKLIRGGELCV